jgi:hypothetical protein
VQGAQPTGALITFPNSEVLRANIVNYTRDFPYVWDEVTVGITNESDLGVRDATWWPTSPPRRRSRHGGPVAPTGRCWRRRVSAFDIADEPQVFVSHRLVDEITVRYLVNARERRRWSSALSTRSVGWPKPEHRERVGRRIRPAWNARRAPYSADPVAAAPSDDLQDRALQVGRFGHLQQLRVVPAWPRHSSQRTGRPRPPPRSPASPGRATRSGGTSS